MKIHFYTLHDGPFNLIKTGQKTIEMRLYDKKRKLLQIGDHIIFENTTTKETLRVTIKELTRFKDFEDLYNYYPKSTLGYASFEVASASDMEIYYQKSAIKKYGTLAIAIEVVNT